MTVSERRPVHGGRLALWAWIAVALAPVGWVLGIVLAFLSGEGEAKGIGPVTLGILGVLLFVAAPATAVVLAVRAARAGHTGPAGSPWWCPGRCSWRRLSSPCCPGGSAWS